MTIMTPAHTQVKTSHYLVHYPEHPARKDDPHYKDFEAYHKKNRPTARCFIGQYNEYSDCKDASGNDAAPSGTFQPGLELHHAHVEFALQNGVDLAALEKDYPGISNPDEVGEWIESGQNFMWLCTFHHRGSGGAHTASASDFEAEKYIRGLISKVE